MTIEIPTAKSSKIMNLGDQVITIYGQAKIGKSTFASRFPNALFAATESGLNFLEVYQVPINSWPDFSKLCAVLASNPQHVETLVIDTVDILYSHCEAHVCEKNNIEHPSQMPYGRGFGELKSEFKRVLTKLSMLRTATGGPMGLVMVSHDRVIEEETRTGTRKYSAPDLANSPRTIIEAMSDLLLFADTEPDGTRVLRTKPDDRWRGGDRSGLLPETMPLDYDELVRVFEQGDDT